MSDLIVIGIAGIAGSGKDSVAGLLCSTNGFTRVSLGDGIRSAFNDLSGITGAFHKELTADFTQRKAWQVLGTEARKAVCFGDLWIGLALAKLYYAAFQHPVKRHRFVIPDISYDREARLIGDAVRSMEGVYETWRVTNPRVTPIAESAHSSEVGRATLTADWTVTNDGTRRQLLERIAGRLETLGIGEE